MRFGMLPSRAAARITAKCMWRWYVLLLACVCVFVSFVAYSVVARKFAGQNTGIPYMMVGMWLSCLKSEMLDCRSLKSEMQLQGPDAKPYSRKF